MDVLNINLFNKYELMRYSSKEVKKFDFIKSILIDQIRFKNYYLRKKGIFINCISKNNPLQYQGWKIHVSASNENYKNILLEVIPYLISLMCHLR